MKRPNGDGSLRKRADNRWEARIQDGFQDNGRPRMRSFYGRTQKEAREKMKAYLDDKAAGLNLEKKYTFREFAEIWFNHHKTNISPVTQESYKYTLRILVDSFGDRLLNDIKPFDIEIFLRKLQEDGRSKTALQQTRAMLYQVFHKAEANDFVRKNPVEFADKMRSREPEKRKEAFTAEEVRLLMEKLPKDRIGHTIRLMLGSGLRTQEMLALEPKHIAEDGSVIQVSQAVNQVRGTVVVGFTKTKSSVREVPIPPSLRPSAIFLRNTPNKFIWEVGKKDTPCNPSYFRDKFKAELSKIEGVRELTPHCCRHTYVSQMQALGVDMPTIQKLVGHSCASMTHHYLHVQSPVQLAAVQKFSEAFPVAEDET